MTTSLPLSRARDASGESIVRPRCAVCDHQLADHDPIGLRYCQATQAHALPRGCICRDP